MIETLLVVGIVMVLTSTYVRHRMRRRAQRRAMRNATGLQVLERRYAFGEIGRTEYLQKRADILGYAAVHGGHAPMATVGRH